jgi:hypothetical protein
LIYRGFFVALYERFFEKSLIAEKPVIFLRLHTGNPAGGKMWEAKKKTIRMSNILNCR